MNLTSMACEGKLKMWQVRAIEIEMSEGQSERKKEKNQPDQKPSAATRAFRSWLKNSKRKINKKKARRGRRS